MNRQECEERVGSTLRGKWKLERLVGFGGMAAVYRARHKIGRIDAIKILHPEMAASPQVRDRFEQEAIATNSIHHPAIVETRDLDTDADGIPFLVMELLAGETLADMMDAGHNVPTPRLLEICDEALDLLAVCHDKGLIHRDIKPDNLFIDDKGQLKVLDFGIARMREGVVSTSAGTMLGTVAYMPPEQLIGHDVDHRVDLYGLGATLYTIISGKELIEASNESRRIALKLATSPKALEEVVAEVDPFVASFVNRAIAYVQDYRYPDARVMRGDLHCVRRGQRPPFAYACEKSGQLFSLLAPKESNKEAQATRVESAGIASTEPQIPVFENDSDKASDDPNMSDPPKKLPRIAKTEPQMPAFDAMEPPELSAEENVSTAADGSEPEIGDDEEVGLGKEAEPNDAPAKHSTSQEDRDSAKQSNLEKALKNATDGGSIDVVFDEEDVPEADACDEGDEPDDEAIAVDADEPESHAPVELDKDEEEDATGHDEMDAACEEATQSDSDLSWEEDDETDTGGE